VSGYIWKMHIWSRSLCTSPALRRGPGAVVELCGFPVPGSAEPRAVCRELGRGTGGGRGRARGLEAPLQTCCQPGAWRGIWPGGERGKDSLSCVS